MDPQMYSSDKEEN